MNILRQKANNGLRRLLMPLVGLSLPLGHPDLVVSLWLKKQSFPILFLQEINNYLDGLVADMASKNFVTSPFYFRRGQGQS
jgi:hypothetical protein